MEIELIFAIVVAVYTLVAFIIAFVYIPKLEKLEKLKPLVAFFSVIMVLDIVNEIVGDPDATLTFNKILVALADTLLIVLSVKKKK